MFNFISKKKDREILNLTNLVGILVLELRMRHEHYTIPHDTYLLNKEKYDEKLAKMNDYFKHAKTRLGYEAFSVCDD